MVIINGLLYISIRQANQGHSLQKCTAKLVIEEDLLQQCLLLSTIARYQTGVIIGNKDSQLIGGGCDKFLMKFLALDHCLRSRTEDLKLI
jgi:hypothetical protein